ncbi:MAG: tRNA (N(6)-L-threonylcarbamoyladenosine(37)-C(2))-methylthiotransferase MtaB [Lachnospiraceae bacterium]|nr:tRNA (N(6)-L-threonylcarbamoyladenosine(37)-C(2))-methylthiotransferase MtaB [Lachnospiraceae bacterium]
MKVAFLTLGCKVNFYETEKMMEQFREKGFEIVEFNQKADIYIVNTCTVTNIADRKSRQMLHRAKKKNPESLVVAVGCYVESGGDTLKKDEAIDVAFSNKEKGNLAERIIDKFGLSGRLQKEYRDRGDISRKIPREIPGERTRAYIKIQDGCNQFCTYCLIPYVRGKGELVSMPEEDVVSRAKVLAERDYHEIVLTGIHLSSYGVDFSGEKSFVKLKGKPLLSLLRRVAEIEGIDRIRLGSLEPRIISKEFLRELSQIPKICPHFHLSLQSGCDTVLKRMNRHYTTVEYRETVNLLRKFFKNPALTTDVIVGFPGETEEEFEQTRTFLQDIRLADIHVFKYSPRSGTKAAAMEEQILPEVKSRRSDILLSDTRTYREEYGAWFMGREEMVLFEEVETEGGEDYLTGHNERYVKIGVPVAEAEKYGYRENEIHRIPVMKVMKK